jgi:hypothetical protein
MDLYQKIISIYPNLSDQQEKFMDGTIMLQNDSDGNGDYIREWHDPDHPRPTQAQLDAVKE